MDELIFSIEEPSLIKVLAKSRHHKNLVSVRLLDTVNQKQYAYQSNTLTGIL